MIDKYILVFHTRRMLNPIIPNDAENSFMSDKLLLDFRSDTVTKPDAPMRKAMY